jgi:hypothetical protein
MELYQVNSDCLFTDLEPAWLIFVRARCRCGHRTRPYLTMDGAANALIRHQARRGTRVA